MLRAAASVGRAFGAAAGAWLLLLGTASAGEPGRDETARVQAPAAAEAAGPVPPAVADGSAAAFSEAGVDAAPLAAFSTATVLSADQLADKRAMANVEIDRITINDSNQDGTVNDNVAIDSDTGRNTIGGDAFRGADGFINSVQNTGNNVLIQSATIINVSIEP